jgi:hypothetical protein
MPNYKELTAYLKSQNQPTVVLSFSQIERIVGILPKSATEHRAWWSNSTASQHHARYWVDAHRNATPDFNAGLVRFTVGGDNRRGPNASTREVTNHLSRGDPGSPMT